MNSTNARFLAAIRNKVAVRYSLGRSEGRENFFATLLTHADATHARPGYMLAVEVDVTVWRSRSLETRLSCMYEDPERVIPLLNSWDKLDDQRCGVEWMRPHSFVGDVYWWNGEKEARHGVKAASPLFLFYTGIIQATISNYARSLPIPGSKDLSAEAARARKYRADFETLERRFSTFALQSQLELTSMF